MIRDSVTIQIHTEFETRPIAMLVQVAGKYRSQIYVESGTKRVNAKSIMGMMSLGLDNGETVVISADGEDEKEALAGVIGYLTQSQA